MDFDKTLKAVSGRIIVTIDLEAKNKHRFADGTIIRLERQYDNFNKRQTQPVNATVIDAENIPTGAQILIGHNSTHEVNQIFDYKQLSGEEISSSIKYYSLPESECFLWRTGTDEWQPIPPFETALRVFKPYTGIMIGVGHEKIKDVLYVTSGKLKGEVVKTIKASDYEIVFQDSNGQENRLIRFRPYGDEKSNREPEAIAILHDATEKVKKWKYIVGLTPSDAKPLNELIHA